jgi:6-phosphofructokinase 1
VANWSSQAGAFLGTNRVLPNKLGIDRVANVIQQRKLNGLIIIGGWEAYVSAQQLYENQAKYPSLRIPMIVIPATISNNCPLTEYSIGSDTALNAIVDSSDRVKCSATSSRRRVFIMECMGGRCGYLTLLGAIAGGAQIAYIPEHGVDLKQIVADADRLKHRFVQCRSTSLIMNAETSSKTYTTAMLNTIFKEESAGRFDVRSLIVGHIQQGNCPSPRDRTQAAAMAHRAVDMLEKKTHYS